MTANPFNVPEKLIYEMVDGKPIYYRGYREYLNEKNSSHSSWVAIIYNPELFRN